MYGEASAEPALHFLLVLPDHHPGDRPNFTLRNAPLDTDTRCQGQVRILADNCHNVCAIIAYDRILVIGDK